MSQKKKRLICNIVSWARKMQSPSLFPGEAFALDTPRVGVPLMLNSPTTYIEEGTCHSPMTRNMNNHVFTTHSQQLLRATDAAYSSTPRPQHNTPSEQARKHASSTRVQQWSAVLIASQVTNRREREGAASHHHHAREEGERKTPHLLRSGSGRGGRSLPGTDKGRGRDNERLRWRKQRNGGDNGTGYLHVFAVGLSLLKKYEVRFQSVGSVRLGGTGQHSRDGTRRK